MSNVTGLRRIDLPMEILGVLYCGEPMTCHEIAAQIERYSDERIGSAHFASAINRLRTLGYEILEHGDPDGVRYELVQPEGAA